METVMRLHIGDSHLQCAARLHQYEFDQLHLKDSGDEGHEYAIIQPGSSQFR
jgi:hypothetical protein